MKKNNKIKIEVNGKLLTVDQNISLLKYIKKIKVPLKKVAIELNHKIDGDGAKQLRNYIADSYEASLN